MFRQDTSSCQAFAEIRQALGNFNLLGTDRLAAAAGDAGAGLFLLRVGHQGHGGDKAAAGKPVLVVKGQQGGDIQPLGAVADALAAGGAGEVIFAQHSLGHFHKRLPFLGS